MNNNTIDIPMPDHLVKFASAMFWEGHSPPFLVKENTPAIGSQFFSLVMDKRTHRYFPIECSTVLSVRLSDTLAKRSPDLIKLSRINKYLEGEFKAALYLWVEAQSVTGSNEYQSLKSFFLKFNLNPAQYIDQYHQYLKRRKKRVYINYKNTNPHEKREQARI